MNPANRSVRIPDSQLRTKAAPQPNASAPLRQFRYRHTSTEQRSAAAGDRKHRGINQLTSHPNECTSSKQGRTDGGDPQEHGEPHRVPISAKSALKTDIKDSIWKLKDLCWTARVAECLGDQRTATKDL